MGEQGAWNDAIPVPTRPSKPVRWASPTFGYLVVQVFLVPVGISVCALLLQYGRLDLELARFVSDPASHTFPWRHSVWLDVLGHQSARVVPILVGVVATVAGIAGFAVRRLRPWRHILLTIGAAMAIGPILIAVLKTMTTLHCPADQQEFGGIVSYALDQAAPFWALSRYTAGHCSPSGHAGGGYALLALYFAGWAAGRRAWRWSGLGIGIAAGLLFSAVRIMQGAHFASATVWSAAVDWTVCALCFLPLVCRTNSSPR
jgi:membrane-associated PAP2 superfamily phosphatase